MHMLLFQVYVVGVAIFIRDGWRINQSVCLTNYIMHTHEVV